jgi:hypothetical protein
MSNVIACVVPQSVILLHQWFRILGTDPQYSWNGFSKKNKISKVTWCFWAIKQGYTAHIGNGAVVVITKCWHASAK